MKFASTAFACLMFFCLLEVEASHPNENTGLDVNFLLQKYIPTTEPGRDDEIDLALEVIRDFWYSLEVDPHERFGGLSFNSFENDFPEIAYLSWEGCHIWVEIKGIEHSENYEDVHESIDYLREALVLNNVIVLQRDSYDYDRYGYVSGETNVVFIADGEGLEGALFLAILLGQAIDDLLRDNANLIPVGPDGALDFLVHYYNGKGTDFDMIKRGYRKRLEAGMEPIMRNLLIAELAKISKDHCDTIHVGDDLMHLITLVRTPENATVKVSGEFNYITTIFALGKTRAWSSLDGSLTVHCRGNVWFFYGTRLYSVNDSFADPLDLKEKLGKWWPWSGEMEGGTPYAIKSAWTREGYRLEGVITR